MTARTHNSFSLLELSVVLIIISLIVAFGFSAGQNALEGADRVTTQTRLGLIKNALENYAAQTGHLPCPSLRGVTTSSSSFGVEARTGTSCTISGDVKGMPPAPGFPAMYIGGVPVRTLGLPDAYAADAWNDKFLYAVSLDHVGDVSAYRGYDGRITVKYGDRTGTNYTLTTARTSCTNGKSCSSGAMATYVVLSHGPNGKGAYPMNGTAVATPCGTATGNDVSNCDETNALATTDNIYHDVFYASAYNDSPTVAAKFFDDYLVWGSNALARAPLVQPIGACGGTLISTTGSGQCVDVANTACSTACIGAGFGAGSAVLNNCSNNTGCGVSGVSCDYQCCCTGSTPTSGCAAQTNYAWTVSGNICHGDITSPLPTTGTVTLINTTAGLNGTATVSCTAGALSTTSSSCSAGTAAAACTGGLCAPWCAPCSNPSNGYPIICSRHITLSNPCQAYCVYGGCVGEPVSTCKACP